MHLTDTGLAAGLLRLDPKGVAASERVRGPLVESLVVGEVARQASWEATPPTLHHFRDHEREIDLVLERHDGRLFAIEVKAGAVKPADARHLAWLRDQEPRRFLGGVVLHGGDGRMPLGEKLWALPISALWA